MRRWVWRPSMATAFRTGLPWGRRTLRTDAWWVEPTVVLVVLLAFVVYATFRVFENAHYSAGVFHTPFGSPDLRGYVPFLSALPFAVSPAMVILPFPAGFRLTCYYYRKAYYRSFGRRPPGCAVEGATKPDYWGERKGPFILQNLHRYFLYAALVVLVFNIYDMIGAFGVWEGHLYVGLGSFLFVLNVALLSGYTLGCHSLRHLVGGKLDMFSCDTLARSRYGLWAKVTWLNGRHMTWAWASLITVALTDLFVRGVSAGWWRDVVLLGGL